MALLVRHGGLGITNPSKNVSTIYEASRKISEPLTIVIHQQSHTYSPEVKSSQIRAKNNTRSLRRQHETSAAAALKARLLHHLQRAMTASTEKGASIWLSTLPIEEHGFALHKGAFRDAICLKYGWRPPLLPSHCACSKQFTVEPALNCPRGGFPSIRHNEIQLIS